MASVSFTGNTPATGSALTVGANAEVVYFNNSAATVNVTVVFDPTTGNDVTNTFTLQGGEGYVARPGAAGTVTPTVVARHTGIADGILPDAPSGAPGRNAVTPLFVYSTV